VPGPLPPRARRAPTLSQGRGLGGGASERGGFAPERGGPARPVGDLVTGALRSLGVPTRAASRRVLEAWGALADPAWAGKTSPTRLVGGTLCVAVSSAPLREELAQFHAARLLDAMRRALPDVPIAALRFEAGRAGTERAR